MWQKHWLWIYFSYNSCMFSFSLELQPLLDEGFEQFFLQLCHKFWGQKFTKLLGRNRQHRTANVCKKYRKNLVTMYKKKLRSSYHLAVRAFKSMSFSYKFKKSNIKIVVSTKHGILKEANENFTTPVIKCYGIICYFIIEPNCCFSL